MRPSLLKYLQIVLFVAIMPFVSLADVEKRNFTLVIHAGHGGHDAGARGSFSNEKDINIAHRNKSIAIALFLILFFIVVLLFFLYRPAR